MYAEMQRPEVVGKDFVLPAGWLPSAKSIISYFFPFSEDVRKSNRGGSLPSSLWLHGRIEGQRFLMKCGEYLVQQIQQTGNQAITPVFSENFHMSTKPPFGSNWSERHVAFISGLGTFGLSKGLITEKGTAGRFLSIVTDIPFEPTARLIPESTNTALCAEPARKIALPTRSPWKKERNICRVRFIRRKSPNSLPPVMAAGNVRWEFPANLNGRLPKRMDKDV